MSYKEIKEHAMSSLNTAPKSIFDYGGETLSNYVEIDFTVWAGKNCLVYSFADDLKLTNAIEVFTHQRLLEICQQNDLGLLRFWWG